MLHDTEHLEKLVSYLKENEECQYSIEELMNQLNDYAGMPKKDGNFTEEVCHVKTLKTALLKTFGDDIIMTLTKTHESVVCF